jgi:hypothetical protein
MKSAILLMLNLVLLREAQAQMMMGPAQGPGEQPTLFFLSQSNDISANEGIKNQSQLGLNVPVYKSDNIMIMSGVSFQNVDLNMAPLPNISALNYQSLGLNLMTMVKSENGNGWMGALNVGSASDQIFSKSEVLTINAQIQRKNKWSEKSNIYYGIMYSNNNALLPGLPIPVFAYEYHDEDSDDFYRIGLPIMIRKNNILQDTHFSIFAIGPIVWDIKLTNKSLDNFELYSGFQKRPETFLLSTPPQADNHNQFMIDQTSFYAGIQTQILIPFTLGLKVSHNFNNIYTLRETGNLSSSDGPEREFEDYSFIGLTLSYALKKPGTK